MTINDGNIDFMYFRKFCYRIFIEIDKQESYKTPAFNFSAGVKSSPESEIFKRYDFEKITRKFIKRLNSSTQYKLNLTIKTDDWQETEDITMLENFSTLENKTSKRIFYVFATMAFILCSLFDLF